jgi:hypothetical protein
MLGTDLISTEKRGKKKKRKERETYEDEPCRVCEPQHSLAVVKLKLNKVFNAESYAV